ncbi:MAG: hypothetical protein GC189_13365 [Alphaproteobacteria bacterium]|nr:hypothetical protein [Alphaproteobacteria bacterium]
MLDAAFLVAQAPWFWLGLALAICAVEVMTGTTYLLWPAAAAALAALAAWAVPGAWPLHVAVFGAAAIVFTWFGPRALRGRWANEQGSDRLNDRAALLVGAKGVAAEAFVNGVGSVRLDDTVWRARAQEALSAGDAVQVTAVEGATVTVSRLN